MNFITLGTFDGVHLGHRRLLGELAGMARAADMKSLVLYFTEPPRAILSDSRAACLLTLPQETPVAHSFLRAGRRRPP